MQSIPFRRPYAQFVLLLLAVLLAGSVAARAPAPPRIDTFGGVGGARAALAGGGVASPGWAADVQPTAAFVALEAQANGPLDVHWDTQTGIPDWLAPVDADGRLPYTPTAAERGNPQAIARGFLDAHRALFRLRSAADELLPLPIAPDLQLGYKHVRLAQVYHGIPVFGKQLIVHLDAHEQIAAVSGQFAPGVGVATEAVLRAGQAEDVALRALHEQELQPAEAARVRATVLPNKTSLAIYVDRAGKATLTWQVKIATTSPLGQWTIFVNANRPVVVHAIDSGDNVRRRQTYSADNTTDIPGDLVIDEGERSNDPVAQAAHDGAGKVYDYYFNTFKRDAYDGQGSPMVSTVHFGSDPQDQENAAWISEAAQMIYGDGGRIFKPLAYGLDVIGHEFTHGVVDSTAQLVYESQSGALNESYADVFGVLISGTDWEVGRDVVKSPPYPLPYLRSLKDPNAEGSYDPNNPLSGVGQPATVDEYANLPISRRFDNGGVHINSGIPNRAAYLVAQAIGKDKMQQVYYRTMTQYLSPESDFLQAANATARAATELYGQNEANAVRTAFGQVGVNIGGADTSPTPPATPGGPPVPSTPAPSPTPPQVPAGCTDVIVSGNFESTSGWTQVTAKSGTNIIDPELPHTGARSAWLGGTDEESFQYIYQDVSLPANATSIKLSYFRLIHEETTGLLGAFSSEAKFSAVIANADGDTIVSLEELKSSQGDDEWHQAAFDLSNQGGKKVRLVFAAENPPRNVSSMFVDDVSMVVCTTGAGPAAPQPSTQDQVYIQGTLSDASTGRGINGAQIFILKPGVSASDAAADDTIDDNEVLTSGVADSNGTYQTEAPVPRNQTYSAIVLARGYRPILADGEVQVPSDAENPYPVDATLRRSF